MAVSSSLNLLSTSSAPTIGPKSKPLETRLRVLQEKSPVSLPPRFYQQHSSTGGSRSSRLISAAKLSEIEPDLNEDPKDRRATNGIGMEDFVFGEYDGHHTYHEGHAKGTVLLFRLLF